AHLQILQPSSDLQVIFSETSVPYWVTRSMLHLCFIYASCMLYICFISLEALLTETFHRFIFARFALFTANLE
ncbi:hypothetical protein, partial [Chitinophaga sp. CF118]|uniref:hypothetical protein n=1 Tax=Chitinophaga sp. CF118 TaxID=1884367 RepID=UPI001C433621